jgi:hypothetical protein
MKTAPPDISEGMRSFFKVPLLIFVFKLLELDQRDICAEVELLSVLPNLTDGL